jgi:hypothetical protein
MSDKSSLVEQQRGEQILASACRFLDEGGDQDLAALLAMGALAAHVRTEEDILFAGMEQSFLDLHLIAPRTLYVVLDEDPQWDEKAATLWGAIKAVIPLGTSSDAPTFVLPSSSLPRTGEGSTVLPGRSRMPHNPASLAHRGMRWPRLLKLR